MIAGSPNTECMTYTLSWPKPKKAKIIYEITGTTTNTFSSSTRHSAVNKTEEIFSIGIRRLSTEHSYKDLHHTGYGFPKYEDDG